MSRSEFSLFVLLVDTIFLETKSGSDVVLEEVFSGDETARIKDAGFKSAVYELALQSRISKPDRVNLFRVTPGDYPAVETFLAMRE